ncbi:MAG: DUF721 domain-containing protein [Candidatus Cloacimonetes bacterium]|nr:DUF721 domain-containing protein [Candidatus Cloacimonadota bacterium]
MSFHTTGHFLYDLIIRIAGEEHKDYATILIGWKEIVGKAVAEKAKPVKFENSILKVAVSNNIWMQELILYKHKIRAQYRKNFKIDIQDIIFFVNT